MANGVLDLPETGRRGRRRAVPRRSNSVLGAKELELHAELKLDGRLKNGRSGEFVYYLLNGRQCWRRHVVPKDPRTAAQLRSRKAFATASKAWS